MSKAKDRGFWSGSKLLAALLVAAALLAAGLFYGGGLELGRKALLVAQAKAGGCPLSLKELWALNPAYELDRTPFNFKAAPYQLEFRRELSPGMRKVEGQPAGSDVYIYLTSKGKPVRVDASLPMPVLTLAETGGPHPVARLTAPEPPPGKFLLYYFEFDTSPRFDSPNFFRIPSLESFRGKQHDLSSRLGMSFYLFSGKNRCDRAGSSVCLPFRVSSLALPLAYGRIGFPEMVKFAQLAGYGLGGPDLVRELYDIVRYRWVWGSDLQMHCPLDTFAAGVGECGNVNNLLGAMLEMHGMRYRLAAGFNPVARTAHPGLGHSAIEVHTPTGWEYLDPYMDVYLPGVPIRQIGRLPQGKIRMRCLPSAGEREAPLAAEVRESIGPALELGEQFRYRIYGDVAGRRLMAWMISLGPEGEKAYGLDWPLRRLRPDEGLDPERDLPREFTVYVRGRYVLTRYGFSFQNACTDDQALASPWAKAQFQVRPLELLAR